MNERIDPQDHAAAGLIAEARQGEAMDVHGRFYAVCTGPAPKDMARWADLYQQYLAAIENGQWDLAEKTEAKLLAIPTVEFWRDEAPNVVCTLGKNLIFDSALAGSSYSVVGPYMGLISSASYSAVAAADTMSSHAGWLEAGATNAPTYTAPRKTCAWSAASAGAKALSSALSFVATGSGTTKGCFIASGTGAVSTIDNTSGVLVSAGLFTGGDQPVVDTNTVAVSYSISG